MPKTNKSRKIESFKLYSRKVAESSNVELSKRSYSLIDTLIREAVKTLADNAMLAKSSSKMLSVGDLETSLSIASQTTASEALQFAKTAVEKYQSSKIENDELKE